MVSLQLRGVSAAYGRREILAGIDTPRFTGGEVVALLGANAAGKSTLLRRVFGLMRGAGEVVVEGAVTPRPMVYMPQDHGMGAVLTVFEAVLLAQMQGRGMRVGDADLRRVDAALADLGISALAQRDVGDLSGGQRQLVSAAQALVQSPEILLLDEPISALDLNRQVSFLTVLQRLARERGMLVVVALHDIGLALRFTDHALVLHQGGLAASGRTVDVVTPALLRRVYAVEARVEPCSRGLPQVIVERAL